MKARDGNLRGNQHLRVQIEIGRKSRPRVTSIWVVDQPVVQQVVLRQPMVAVVEVAGDVALVEAFDDPRVVRGTFREEPGHSYLKEDTGLIEVSVPFESVFDLSDVHIRMKDTSGVTISPRGREDLVALFQKPVEGVREVGEINTPDLERHGDWDKVAKHLGVAVESGRFEIYRDNVQEFRWRLRRRDGVIAAESGQGYATRHACEQDLGWVRKHAPRASVFSLDLDGTTKPEKR